MRLLDARQKLPLQITTVRPNLQLRPKTLATLPLLPLSHGVPILSQPCGEGSFDDFLLAEEFSGGELAFQRSSFESSGDFRTQSNGDRNQPDWLKTGDQSGAV